MNKRWIAVKGRGDARAGLSSPVTDLIDARHRQSGGLGELLAGDALLEPLADQAVFTAADDRLTDRKRKPARVLHMVPTSSA